LARVILFYFTPDSGIFKYQFEETEAALGLFCAPRRSALVLVY
jgi:hypothetical protein